MRPNQHSENRPRGEDSKPVVWERNTLPAPLRPIGQDGYLRRYYWLTSIVVCEEVPGIYVKIGESGDWNVELLLRNKAAGVLKPITVTDAEMLAQDFD